MNICSSIKTYSDQRHISCVFVHDEYRQYSKKVKNTEECLRTNLSIRTV